MPGPTTDQFAALAQRCRLAALLTDAQRALGPRRTGEVEGVALMRGLTGPGTPARNNDLLRRQQPSWYDQIVRPQV